MEAHYWRRNTSMVLLAGMSTVSTVTKPACTEG